MIGIFQNANLTKDKIDIFVENHYELVLRTIKHLKKVVDKKEFITFLDICCKPYSFENVIKADFKMLVGLVSDERFKAGNELLQNRYGKGDKNILVRAYNNFRRKYGNQHIEQLEISVCPYCNRGYISCDRDSLADIDHFFPKKDYPLLGLSYYNMVPCCHGCNKFKHTEVNLSNMAVSPFERTIRTDDMIKFGYDIDFKNGKAVAKQIKIIPIGRYKERVSENIRMFHLQKQYNAHLDIVDDLFEKYEMYNEIVLESYNDIFKQSGFDGAFSRKELFYGVGLHEENYYLRPLSKFTKDILSEIEQL